MEPPGNPALNIKASPRGQRSEAARPRPLPLTGGGRCGREQCDVFGGLLLHGGCGQLTLLLAPFVGDEEPDRAALRGEGLVRGRAAPPPAPLRTQPPAPTSSLPPALGAGRDASRPRTDLLQTPSSLLGQKRYFLKEHVTHTVRTGQKYHQQTGCKQTKQTATELRRQESPCPKPEGLSREEAALWSPSPGETTHQQPQKRP